VSCCYSLSLIITRFSSCGLSHAVKRHSRYHHVTAAAVATTASALVQAVPRPPPCLDQPSQLLTILFLLIEAILFGIFTSCMMFDQADVIRSKVTHIDRLTGSDVSGSLAGVLEVFGVATARETKRSIATAAAFHDNNNNNNNNNNTIDTGIRLDWFSPFAQVCFPSRDEVMGFCRPCLKNRTMTTKHHTDSPLRRHQKKDDRALPLADIV
jgi:hypothetical protein